MGRPQMFNGRQRRHVATLVRKHGLTGALKVLSASPGTAEAKERSDALFPEPVSPTLPTLSRYAAEYGVEVKRGRRPAEAVAV